METPLFFRYNDLQTELAGLINEEDTQTNPLEKDIIESTAEDGAKTQEDKDKNEPDEELIPPEEANMEEIILKNPEDGLLINQPSPSQDYEYLPHL